MARPGPAAVWNLLTVLPLPSPVSACSALIWHQPVTTKPPGAGGLPYTLATGCCSQPLNGSIVDHFIPQEARCLPSTDSMVHRPLASKRRLGEADICPNEPELSATEAGSPVTGELPLAGRCKRVSCVPACADRQGPAEGQEGPRFALQLQMLAHSSHRQLQVHAVR